MGILVIALFILYIMGAFERKPHGHPYGQWCQNNCDGNHTEDTPHPY